MTVIRSKSIQGKTAQMILCDDGTVEVHYGKETIFSSGNHTWNNMKDEEWLIDGVINIVVQSYLEEQGEPDDIFHQLCAEMNGIRR